MSTGRHRPIGEGRTLTAPGSPFWWSNHGQRAGAMLHVPAQYWRRETMAPEYAEILRLMDARDAAISADRAAPTPATRWARRAANDQFRAARAAVRDAFAAQHGWIYGGRLFTFDQLRRGSNQWGRDDRQTYQQSPMDHVEYFRLATRGRPPVAILSHEYEPFESGKAIALAREYGLTATLLPTSWYWPGRANAVLYTGIYSLCL